MASLSKEVISLLHEVSESMRAYKAFKGISTFGIAGYFRMWKVNLGLKFT